MKKFDDDMPIRLTLAAQPFEFQEKRFQSVEDKITALTHSLTFWRMVDQNREGYDHFSTEKVKSMIADRQKHLARFILPTMVPDEEEV